MRSADGIAETEGGGKGPSKVAGKGVVVTQRITGGILECQVRVAERGGSEGESLASTNEYLIDGLASVHGVLAGAGREGEGTNESVCVTRGRSTASNMLNPRINGSSVRDKVAERIRVSVTSVTRVGVSHNDERHSSRPSVDPGGQLGKVFGTGIDISRFVPGVGVKVVKINPDTFINANTGKGETLRC